MMESTGPSNPNPVNTDEWTVMPPRLMRLEERIVLDAAGMSDGGSDSDTPDDAQHEPVDRGPVDTRDTEDKATSGDRDGRSDAPDGSGRSTAEPADPMDRVNRLVAGAIEKAIRPVAERATDLSVLGGLLDGLRDVAGDATTSDTGSAVQLFSLLSDALQDIFDGGLAAMLNQQRSAGPSPDPHADLDAGDARDTAEADSDAVSAGASPVLVVSSSVDQADTLAAAAGDDVISVVFDGENMTPDELLRQIQDLLGDQKAQSIALATNGLGDGGFELSGGVSVNLNTLQDTEMQAFWMGLAEMVEPGGRIDLLACDAAAGSQGQELLASLEDLTGVNFAASTDKTGGADRGGDWVLESDDIDTAEVYFAADGVSAFTAVLGDLMPTITDTDPGNTANGGGAAVVVDAGITVDDGDPGADNLQGAVVRIRTGFQASEDQLSFNAGLATGFGISGSYDAATGELVLSGSATDAQYQQVLRTVTYQNTSATPDTTAREILFVIGDDYDGYAYNAANGHYYRFIGTTATWAAADAAADASTLGGLQGYLATVTSAGENTIVTPTMGNTWLGANDDTVEGEWYWVVGPESGIQFWQGNGGGAAVGGRYEHWEPGEPNEGAGGNYLIIKDTGNWIDLDSSNSNYYCIEYGGLGADSEGQLVASVTMNVAAPAGNNAPVLDNTGDMSLTAIAEDNTASAGDTVAAIVLSATGNRITDVDGGALEGIAITAIDNTNGTWQYSTDGGTSWTNIGAVANNNALLLRDTDLVRFQPGSNWNGTVATGITFRAWDQVVGTQGNYADASANGGATTFSSATETASITVNAGADAPVLDNTGDMSLTAIAEDNTASAGNTVASIVTSATGDRITDPDAGALEGVAITAIDNTNGTWQYSTDGGTSWTNIGAVANNNALLLRDTDLVRFQPDSNWNGTVAAGVTFRAWDTTSGTQGNYVDASTNGGATAFSTATETASLTVSAGNDAPTVAIALVDQTATEDVAFTYQFASNAFSDVDTGDTLTYSATLSDGNPLPTWLTFNAATRTFSGTPTNAEVGTLNLKVTANDGKGGTVSDSFTLTVLNVNDAPTLANPLVDQTATEDVAFTYQFASDAFDDADADDTLTYTATLADGSALPDWLSFDAGTRTFTGTPTDTDVGPFSVKVTANDGNGGSVSDTFTITVANVNDVPTVANPLVDQTAEEGSPFTYSFASDAFDDADADDTLTYTATLADGSALPDWLSFDAGTRTLSGTPGPDDAGEIVVKVTAGDGNGGTASDTFTITVSNVNVAPTVANPLVDQTADEGTPFTYSFASDAFDDADADDTLTYTATLADGGALPSWLSFDADTRTFTGTPTEDAVGTFEVKVTADDGNGETVSDTFVITVSDMNDAPTLAIPLVDQTAVEDSPFTYQFTSDTFHDANVDDTLTYAATLADGGALPGWLGFDVNTRTFFGTPTAGDIGTINVKVTAVDGDGQSVSDSFTITVSDANHTPMLANPLADQTVEEGSRFTYQFASNTFEDIDAGDALTYSAALADGGALPGWLSFDAHAGVFSGTPTGENIGTLSVVVTASDVQGDTVSDVFTITVIAETEEPPEEVEILNTPVTTTPTSTSDSSSSGTDSGADSSTSSGMDAGDAGDSGTSADAADGGDAGTDGGEASDSGDSADAGDTADSSDASDSGDAGDGGDAGGDASSAAGDAGGDAAGGEAGVAGGSRSSGRQGGSDVEHHEREEQVQLEAGQLTSQVSNVMLSGDLLSDDSQPEEFREAWNAILGAYVASGDELSIYLQSAFRAVNESAVMYQGAEQAIDTLHDELALAGELDMPVDSDTLLAGVLEARDEVKAASRELEAAILAAAEAGRGNAFDRVLEDVISAALQSLMAANEQLYAETKALAAATAVLRDARLAGDKTIEPEKIASANAQARAEARAAVTEMRERWDRIAQDVFSAFVGRLAAEKAGEADSEQSG